MIEGAVRRSQPSAGGANDAYADLLSGTRRLQREQRAAREAWLAALAVE